VQQCKQLRTADDAAGDSTHVLSAAIECLGLVAVVLCCFMLFAGLDKGGPMGRGTALGGSTGAVDEAKVRAQRLAHLETGTSQRGGCDTSSTTNSTLAASLQQRRAGTA
jgi:hypothetical protein